MVDIKIIGKSKTPEYDAAESLARLFESSMPSYQRGAILIAAGFTCFGEKTKDIDLVVVGQFERGFPSNVVLGGSKTRVFFHNFCFTIEVKDHAPQDIRFQGFRAEVLYKGVWSDATDQSKKQTFALANFLRDTVNWNPFVCSFLWFRNLTMADLEAALRNLIAPAQHGNLHTQHNWLPSEFPLDFLFQLACVAKPPFTQDHGDGNPTQRFYCAKNQTPQEVDRKITEAHALFTKIQHNLGRLTRDKLEKFTKEAILKDQQYAQAIGKRLVVVKGRAGTGKTIKLIHIAYDLCKRQGERCLLLTYNKALVSDIRRTIALARVKSDLDAGAVQVESVHAFMRKLLVGFGSYKNEQETPFLARYEPLKEELLGFLTQGVVTRQDIQQFMKENADEVAWDKILIDEGQDWPENEKEILFRIFDSKNFIVADGVDQLTRDYPKLDWTKGVDHHKPVVGEKKSLRQKANLCRFENHYAAEVSLEWEIEAKQDFAGGKVIITGQSYSPALHARLTEACEKDGNKPYEMLFLVPPSLVEKEPNPRRFALTDLWTGEWGISLWDGTLSDTRTEYPRDVSQHRLLQYDSCRGLEGWVVVCIWLDDFISHKKWVFDKMPKRPSEELFDPETGDSFAYRWSMIPMTRAVDTLVITLKNPNGAYGQLLRSVAAKNPDFVEWID
jgi:hypothetical protein